MAAAEVVVPDVLPEPPLSERERKLVGASDWLRKGALVFAGVAALVTVAAIIATLLDAGGLLDALKTALAFRFVGDTPSGLAVVILLSLLNASLLLVVMVGVVAREVWALPMLVLMTLANLAALALIGFTPGLIIPVVGLLALQVVRGDLGAFRVNPVMMKELRGRMRGMRAFVVMTVYLMLMSGFATLIYFSYTADPRRLAMSSAAGEIGRVLFIAIVGIELLLIIFIAPAFTAGAITGERERQTYDLLRTTLLAIPSFVMGKLESALGYILLLLLAAVPLQSIAFLFGGVSEGELVLSFVILTVTAIALGTLGIFYSSTMPRTLSASVRAYSATMLMMFVTPLVLSLILSFVGFTLPQWLGATTSRAGILLEAVVTYLQLFLTSMNPISTAVVTQELLINRRIVGLWSETLSDGSTIPMVSPWISFTILYLAVSAVLIVITVRRTRREEA